MSNPYQSPESRGRDDGNGSFGKLNVMLGLLAISFPAMSCFIASFSVSPDLVGLATVKHSSVVALCAAIVFLLPLVFLKVLRNKFVFYAPAFALAMSLLTFCCYRYLLIALIGV